MIVRHLIVSGRVQGVGFRAATADTAGRLGLRGWVRNLDDGRVELVTGGDTTAMDRLHAWLADGPAMACVTDIHEHDAPSASDLPASFVIR